MLIEEKSSKREWMTSMRAESRLSSARNRVALRIASASVRPICLSALHDSSGSKAKGALLLPFLQKSLFRQSTCCATYCYRLL